MNSDSRVKSIDIRAMNSGISTEKNDMKTVTSHGKDIPFKPSSGKGKCTFFVHQNCIRSLKTTVFNVQNSFFKRFKFILCAKNI